MFNQSKFDRFIDVLFSLCFGALVASALVALFYFLGFQF